MRKIFHDIHLWLSVPFGIIIALICFSGAMLVFEQEITQKIQKEIYFVEAQDRQPLPADSLMLCATRQLPDSVSITGLTIYPEPDRAWQLSLSKPKKAAAYINPYTGELTARPNVCLSSPPCSACTAGCSTAPIRRAASSGERLLSASVP